MTDVNAARPIGWWLKEADRRLDAAFDDALRGTGVNRRTWQVLNSLAAGPADTEDLLHSLAVFDPPDVLRRVVDETKDRGWVEENAAALRLTAHGEAQQAALAPLVSVVRQRVREALPEDDYVTLVRLLVRLADALTTRTGGVERGT